MAKKRVQYFFSRGKFRTAEEVATWKKKRLRAIRKICPFWKG